MTRWRMIGSLAVAATLAGGCGSHGSNAPAAGPTESPSSPLSSPSPSPTLIRIPPIHCHGRDTLVESQIAMQPVRQLNESGRGVRIELPGNEVVRGGADTN